MDNEDIHIGLVVEYLPYKTDKGLMGNPTIGTVTHLPFDVCGTECCMIDSKSGSVSIDHLRKPTKMAAIAYLDSKINEHNKRKESNDRTGN